MQGTPCAGQAEFIIAKHRNGALENIRLRFINEQAKFTDLEPSYGNNDFEIQSSMNDGQMISKMNNGGDSDFEFNSSINLPTSNPLDSFGDLGSFSSSMNDDDSLPF